MIRVKLFFHDENLLTGIECSGHSGSAEKGHDIICAAVSVLMQSLMLGLEDVAQLKDANFTVDANTPLMRVTWPVNECGRISVLTRTISESLKQIARDNPDYVKIISEVSK